jgi:large subunit ribosomal protein L22
MPKWGYSISEGELDPEKTVKASGRELRVSYKSARETCNSVKGMKLVTAKFFLGEVIAKRKAVPFKRFHKKMPHRHGFEGAFAGRYPVKAAKYLLAVLEGAEASAEYKGLDVDRLRVIHASAYPGIKIKRFIPRAHGRSNPKFKTLCHIEVALREEAGDER